MFYILLIGLENFNLIKLKKIVQQKWLISSHSYFESFKIEKKDKNILRWPFAVVTIKTLNSWGKT